MINNKICPVCEAKNELNSLVCYVCGSTFTTGGTLRVERPSENKPNHMQQVGEITKMYGDSFVLYVVGDENPIIVSKKEERITIGRAVPGSESPLVDLMEYGAGMLGISRIHAAITPSEHGYMIEDMNSTNGTWLNGVRLMPHAPSMLHNGDKLRLGEMSLFIYFSMEETSEQTLMITDPAFESMAQRGLDANYISRYLLPFLGLIGDLQTLLNNARQIEALDVTINAIVFARQHKSLTVNVENAGAAADIIRNAVTPWKQSTERTNVDALMSFIMERGDLPASIHDDLSSLILKIIESPLTVIGENTKVLN